jgi:Fic family protein
MTSTSTMEPLLPEAEPALDDRATELIAKASGLMGRSSPILAAGIGDVVRSMNCYYSNLIEGHQTLPADIDRALNGDYAREPERRNLQMEARAHIDVQRLIDRGEAPTPVVSKEFIIWIHREFCRRLPDECYGLQTRKAARDCG